MVNDNLPNFQRAFRWDNKKFYVSGTLNKNIPRNNLEIVWNGRFPLKEAASLLRSFHYDPLRP